MSIGQSEKTHFWCKTPIFCANLIEIRVKRSKVSVIKWSYLDSPDRVLKDQITGFVVKLSKAVSLAYSIAKATFLELYE